MISTIAFDYGGVIHISDTDLTGDICRYLNITKDAWHEVYFSLNHLSNVGTTSGEEVILMTAQKLNASEDQISHIKNLYRNGKSDRLLNLELIEYIKELKKSHKIAILSNYKNNLRSLMQEQEILDLFDELIISGEVGYQKPQPEIFELLCTKMNIKMSELVFVDDTKRSLEGAENIGYIPILYKNNDLLKSELEQIINNTI